MARVAPEHPAYRAEDKIVRDVRKVPDCDLLYSTKLAVLNNIGWLGPRSVAR